MVLYTGILSDARADGSKRFILAVNEEEAT